MRATLTGTDPKNREFSMNEVIKYIVNIKRLNSGEHDENESWETHRSSRNQKRKYMHIKPKVEKWKMRSRKQIGMTICNTSELLKLSM